MEIIKVNPGEEQIFKDIEKMARDIWTEHYAFLHADGQNDYMLEKFQSYEVIKKQIETGELYYYIVKEDGDYAGYFAIAPKNGSMYLSKLYVYKHFRGRGISKAILEFIKQQAKAQNLKEITLNVNRNNTSVAAYKKLGFQVYNEAARDIGNGYVMDDFDMKLTF
ncbi:ribosomal protein S18 acetylase RimI-like enzyme [Elusimicrobium posterum]|uniref:GNAT family N-acetyltransferase n=1 Tax=Elusimicrobium posterum TaxID=3116653 RepID=UPI003C78E1B3